MEMPPLDNLLTALRTSKGNRSLLKKYLTPELFDLLKERTSALGCNLALVLVSGVELPNSSVGVYAPDTDVYNTFWELMEPIICSLFNLKRSTIYQPPSHMTGIGDVTLDPDGKYILSSRIRLARNLEGYPLPALSSRERLLEIEQLVINNLSTTEDENVGNYLSLATITEDRRESLRRKHLAFNKDDSPNLTHGRVYRHWPAGRGIFMSPNRDFLIWVNEEDHLRLITMTTGGHIGKIYSNMIKAERKLSKLLKFSRNDRLGYLTFCPTNLGTTLRASVHIRIPRVSSMSDFKQLCESLRLEVRGTMGETTSQVGGVYDISNKRRLGLTEDAAVCEMVRGVKLLIALEKRMEERKETSKR